MIDEYTGKKIVSPLDLLPGRLLPDEILTSLSDEDFNSLWKDRKLKPFLELPKHIQEMPMIRNLFGL